MKVISLLQPWATLVVLGHKKIETRSWKTKHRGPLLIHASAGKQGLKLLKNGCMSSGDLVGEVDKLDLLKYDYPLGAIIGQVNLINTIKSEEARIDCEVHVIENKICEGTWHFTEQELAFGDYSEGRYGWLFSDPVQFAKPMPAKGSLSLWEYDMPDHFHYPNKYGGHSTFSSPPTRETLEAIDKMTEVAYNKKIN